MNSITISSNSQENSGSPFDSIRRLDSQGRESWSARELMPLLGYTKWDKFKQVIEVASENLETVTADTFKEIFPVEVKSTTKPLLDYNLSRLACYHIALSCDSRGNEQVKLAKHYFVVKAREAELTPAPLPRQLPPVRDTIEYIQASKDIAEIADPILKSYLLQSLYEDIGATKSLPPSEEPLVVAAVKARSLGYNLKPGEDSKLGKWVAKHCNPLGKTQHGRYPVNVYRDDNRLVETITAFFA